MLRIENEAYSITIVGSDVGEGTITIIDAIYCKTTKLLATKNKAILDVVGYSECQHRLNCTAQ